MIHTKTTPADQTKAMKILARSVYRHLQAGGYAKSEIVHFASEVIGLIASAGHEGMKGEEESSPR